MPQPTSNAVSLNPIESSSCRCKVCGGEADLFDVVDFKKVCGDPDQYLYGLSGTPIYYFRCDTCGFIFARAFDEWSRQQFAEHIYNSEYHLVDGDYAERRPQMHAKAIATLLAGHEKLRLLDYGTGSGAFVKQLGELGFANVSGFDPHSFPERPKGRFDIVLALEVIQHAADPHKFLTEIRQFLAEGGAVILATTLSPADIAHRRGAWIYLAPRNGHISLYSESALLTLAQQHQMRLCRGDDFLGMIPEAGSAIADIISERIGPVLHSTELGAPTAERETGRQAAIVRSQWHAVETAVETAFRWTQSPAIEWRLSSLPAYPALLRVKVPVLMEITPGFMKGCVLTLDGERHPATACADGLEAEFVIQATRHGHAVVLETPEPTSPDELGTARGDMRKLGLAIRVSGERKPASASSRAD